MVWYLQNFLKSNGFWRSLNHTSLCWDNIFFPVLGITLALGVLGGSYENCESMLMYVLM